MEVTNEKPDDFYTNISRITGVARDDVKKIVHIAGYSGSDPSPSLRAAVALEDIAHSIRALVNRSA